MKAGHWILGGLVLWGIVGFLSAASVAKAYINRKEHET
jgi:hypothetical protein